MIDVSIFSKDYIIENQKEFKCDPSILERTIFASGLLEALIKSGMDFVFKGGSSLLFLLDKPLRLSTDIDIVINQKLDIISYISKISVIYPFIRYEENIRKSNNEIKKRHFKFFYRSLNDSTKEVPILLDVLFEEIHYSKIILKEIKNDIIKTIDEKIYVKMPSPESLLGDKLTAFAPKTIGVKPILKREDGIIIDKRIETIKQFFDCISLFDIIENFNKVIDSYYLTAITELKYRGLNLKISDCLIDTFNAAVSIVSRGKIDPQGYKNYLIGIKGLASFLINSKFTAETACIQGAKIMYLTACLMKNATLEKHIPEQNYLVGEYSKLNYLKKIDTKSFNYAARAISIIKNEL